MNPFQEVILDRLIGASPDDIALHSGALGLAFQSLVDAGLIHAEASALDLGYPLLLSTAIDAASGMLRAPEEQRELGLAIFGAVPPWPRPPVLPARRQVAAAMWCACRVHPLICRADCTYLTDAAHVIEAYCKGKRPAANAERPRFFACTATNTIVWDPVQMSAITLRHLGYHTIDKVLEAAGAEANRRTSELSSRAGASYAGRIAALLQGTAGASAFCVELAHELGM